MVFSPSEKVIQKLSESNYSKTFLITNEKYNEKQIMKTYEIMGIIHHKERLEDEIQLAIQHFDPNMVNISTFEFRES